MHIYFKLITLPANEEKDSKEFQIWYDKYSEAKEIKSLEDGYKDYIKEASKNPSFGKIEALVVGYTVEDSQIRINILKGSERSILQSFFNLFSGDYFKNATPVMWNAEFILPFISTRALKNKLSLSAIPATLKHHGLKPWNLKCIDLQSYIKGVGYYIPNLEEAAMNFNLETAFIDLEDVYSYFKNGHKEVVFSSAENELKTVINIHRILQEKEPIEEVVSTQTTVEDEVKEVEVSLLDKLYESNNFSDLIKKELKDILNKV